MAGTNKCQSRLKNHGNVVKETKFPVKCHTNKKAWVATTILRYTKLIFREFLRALGVLMSVPGKNLQLFSCARYPHRVTMLSIMTSSCTYFIHKILSASDRCHYLSYIYIYTQ
jgi:hypothetical protein